MTRGRSGAPGQRQLRVGEEIRHALSRILARGDLRDPVLAAAQVTVTEVRMTPDLKAATAFVTPLGGGDAADLLAALRRAAGWIRGQVAREVTLRFAPEIRFEADRSFDQASRIERLLREPAVARDLEEGEAGDEGEGKDGP